MSWRSRGEAVALVGDREPGVLLARLQQVDVARHQLGDAPHRERRGADRERQPGRVGPAGHDVTGDLDRDGERRGERERGPRRRHITPTTATYTTAAVPAWPMAEDHHQHQRARARRSSPRPRAPGPASAAGGDGCGSHEKIARYDAANATVGDQADPAGDHVVLAPREPP